MTRQALIIALLLAALASGCGPVSFIGRGKDAVTVQPAPGGTTTGTFSYTPAPAPSGN